MAYKQKYKQYIMNAAKNPPYFCKEDCIVFNLNANFSKRDNFSKFDVYLKECRDLGSKINLCNLASLCYKLRINYASIDTLNFVKQIVNRIKNETDLQIVQENVFNCGETDMKPLENLVSFDLQHDIIYANWIILDCLSILGYTDNQLYEVVDFSKDLKEVLPTDLINSLPIMNRKNAGCYNMIKELLC